MSSIGSKRSLSPPTSNAKKRTKIDFDYDSKFIASSQDDLDIGLLRVQNRRLAERLHQRKRVEADLCARIEQMEKKQLNDDTKLYVINRYWNQLNEDMRLILQRFDDQTNDDGNENETDSPGCELNTENAETTSFMRQLANCDKEELDEALQQRVLLSTRAVSKVLQAFDRIVQRQEKITSALKNCNNEDDIDSDTIKSPDQDGEKCKSNKARPVVNLDETIKELNQQLTKENKNLNCMVTSLHEKNHTMSLKYTQLKDKMESNDLQLDELKNRIDELEFELNKSRTREQRLEDHLYETREKLRILQSSAAAVEPNADNGIKQQSGGSNGDTDLSSAKIEDLKRDLEEQREMAMSRLHELEQLNNSHKDTLKLVEKYKLDLQCLPDSVIQESAEYKSLQSHFSVLFNESMQLKAQLEETRVQLTTAKNTHLRQIEHMESEELSMQKRLRNECIQLEDSLSQVRKEYEMLRLEFEQTLAANEQTGPINREMRHLISSLQNHTQQLKGENARIKKKLKEYNKEIARLREIIEQNGLKLCCGSVLLPDNKTECNSCSVECSESADKMANSSQVKSEFPSLSSDSSNDAIIHNSALVIKTEDNPLTSLDENKVDKPEVKLEPSSPSSSVKKESPTDSNEQIENFVHFEVGGNRKLEEVNKDLKMHLKKSLEAQRELKLLLDMFKSVDKEKREKAQIMTNEKKLKLEVDELKQQVKKLHEAAGRGDRRKISDEDYHRKIAKYEEAIAQLQKNVTAHKQEEEALLNEMEVTGQAFEDMQEQNIRLLQQLREKDDANFKLMSERIKSNQIHKLLKEEKDLLTEQVLTLQSQVDAQNQVVRKLEEKERLLQSNLATVEKELSLRQQTMDFHKRKAIESSQAAADLKLHLDKYVAQIRDAQSIVADKTSAWQQEMFKTKRLHEEIQSYKRKYERAKKFELATTADEVLQEEIRELKEELTCPSCKTKRKDAVLNKCFHVFCYDCLKTRYETRQRKCPKCNQSFSANDFHRLYLA